MARPPLDRSVGVSHTGLRSLALFEGLKGIAALAAAASLEWLGPQPIRQGIESLGRHFNLDPGSGPLSALARQVRPDALHAAVAIVLLYAVVRLVEAWGLWRARAWASWLGCIGTAAYLPLDLYALAYHPGWQAWTVLALNLIVVAVLGRDLMRRRALVGLRDPH